MEKQESADFSENKNTVSCPICNKEYYKVVIEDHVNKCLFLNNSEESTNHSTSKRINVQLKNSPCEKRIKLDRRSSKYTVKQLVEAASIPQGANAELKQVPKVTIPLAEYMRPLLLDDLVGQEHSFGPGSMLHSMLKQKKIPNMILWGPPGCGKTSMANVVGNMCKGQSNLRFVKLSATTSGINDVKEIVKVAKNEAQFKRHTVLFMDEIHRFNKLQQDTFLPHVENGTITLIGATTENPSFSLNNALLSRCRVVIMEKLTVDAVLSILKRALRSKEAVVMDSEGKIQKNSVSIPKFIVEEASLRWLAEVCDGDARVALGGLELALAASEPGPQLLTAGPGTLTLEDVQNGIKRSHMLYDRQGEEHYNIISAIHKSIRASDDNAALYWTTRALHGGEDPLHIARRLVRAASEDIGLGDQNALAEAVACLHGCQQIGMPECDVLLAQCAVRLARAPKSMEVYHAMKRCQQSLKEAKGPLPPVPLHLRNAPTKLIKQLGYGNGYNVLHKNQSGLAYMPEGMEEDFFSRTLEDDDDSCC